MTDEMKVLLIQDLDIFVLNELYHISIFSLHPDYCLFCVSVQLSVVRLSPTMRECFCHQTIR